MTGARASSTVWIVGQVVNRWVARGAPTARWHLAVIAFVALAACGDDDDSSISDDDGAISTDAPPEVSAVDTTDVVDTTRPSTTTTAMTTSSEPPASTTTSLILRPDFGPSITELCPAGQTPVAAGYDHSTGSLSWITCVAEPLQYFLLDSDGDTVLAVEGKPDPSHPTGGTAQFVGLDGRDGTVLWRLDQHATSVPDHNPLSNGLAVVTLETTDGHELAGVGAVAGEVVWTAPIAQGAEVANTDSVVIVQSNAPPGGVLPDPTPATPTRPPPDLPGTNISRRALVRASGSESWTSDTTIQIGGPLDFNAMVTTGNTVIAMPGPIAFDADTGDELWRIESDPPGGRPWPGSDEIVLMGGQDDPLSGLDLATGEVRWTAEGHPYFDNVWAVGGGAVYVTTDTDVIAYELADGSVRWRRPRTEPMYFAPWTATDDAVYSIEDNLVSWSSQDGSMSWATNYRFDDQVRMSSVVAAQSNVVVTFTSQPMRD